MRKTWLLPAALIGGLTLSLAAPAADRPSGEGHRWPRGPMMEELRKLDLSEAQRASVREIFEGQREQFRAEHERLRGLRQAWNATVPGTPDYRAAAAKLADAEADAGRTRMLRHAEVRTQIYGLLTEAQKAQFREDLARERDERPEPPREGERPEPPQP